MHNLLPPIEGRNHFFSRGLPTLGAAPTDDKSAVCMICTGCGAEANASCHCGKPYMPKSVRAAEAIKANPEKSDRAIAAEIAVDHKTVGAARKATGEKSPVDKRVGLDGKVRKMPAKKADVEPEPIGFTPPDYDGLMKANDKLERAHQKLLRKQSLPKDDDGDRFTLNDYFDLSARTRKLEARNSELSAALNAKEGQASRNWPADMAPRQVKRRDNCLKQIAAWQRSLEQLYGEVTGCPSWRVEVATKDGRRLGTGARFGTRGEAEFCNTHFATKQVGGDYATGEIIACKSEKANVSIEGDKIYYHHGDCYLLDWQPLDKNDNGVAQ
jgi:hypothetical protein